MTSSPKRSLGRLLLVIALPPLFAAAVLWRPSRGPDMTRVFEANLRGVGLMDQFEYAGGIAAFEEAVSLAPDWAPARINLALALRASARGRDSESEKHRTLDHARKLFEGVLAREKRGPYAAHANFGLGLIALLHENRSAEASPYFERVIQIDPGDPAAWCYLGGCHRDDPARAAEYYRKAVNIDPSLSEALWGLRRALHELGNDEEARELLRRWQELSAAEWTNQILSMYHTDLGKYAQLIGRVPVASRQHTGPLPVFQQSSCFRTTLPAGARWATRADTPGELRRHLRDRFGVTAIVLDFNLDDKPDLFVLGAVVERGEMRDVLLRNEGGNHFTDVTAAAGLAGNSAGVGCTAADFDNDGMTDLLVTRTDGVGLFRNTGRGTFEDVTGRAGLSDLRGVTLGATFVELDQDGDLDLVVARYASSPEMALERLRGGPRHDGGFAFFLNVGEAPAVNQLAPAPPLKPAFRRLERPELAESSSAVTLAVTDLDQDGDVDLVASSDGVAPSFILNDRLLRFRRFYLPTVSATSDKWNGALVLDANRDERGDLLLIAHGRKPALLSRHANRAEKDVGRWFEPGVADAPPLRHAQAIDLDLDGGTDVVGLSDLGKPVFVRNEDGRLVRRPGVLGPESDWPGDLVAAVCADFNGDATPDVLVWSDAGGPRLYENRGNGNRCLRLILTGRRGVLPPTGNLLRSNADGFGAHVIAHAGTAVAVVENTTFSAGLGQSSQPLTLGLGRRGAADLMRIRWPDLTRQAELGLPAASPRDRHFGATRVEETNRKITSCPVLFSWDGRRFVFVTDFLGEGSLGEPLPGGGHRRPRPEESVKIEAEQLLPRDGRYDVRVAEPMDEVTYLDNLRLVVLDHPADVRVEPDERFEPESEIAVATRRRQVTLGLI